MVCQDCSSNDYRGRFESRILFVSKKDDTNKEKQYLFSMSSYKSLVELIDVDTGDDLNYLAWDTLKFFNIDRPIFSLEYSLFELGQSNTYITAYIESAGFKKNEKNEEKEYSNTTTIKKFQIDDYATNDYRTILKDRTLTNTYNGRCVSAFQFDISKKIVLLFVEPNGDSGGKYIAYFYDESLTKLGDHVFYGDVKNLWVGFGIFLKGISVKDDGAALAFFHDGGDDKSLVFKYVKYLNNTYFNYKHEYKFTMYHFNQDVDTNGLYKLNDDRIVLLTTEVIYKDNNYQNTNDNNKI
jgi:hypothetical protein